MDKIDEHPEGSDEREDNSCEVISHGCEEFQRIIFTEPV